MQIFPPGRLFLCCRFEGMGVKRKRNGQGGGEDGKEASRSMLNHILYATQTYICMSEQQRRNKQPREMRVRKKCVCMWEDSEMDVRRVPTSGGSGDACGREMTFIDQLNPYQPFPSFFTSPSSGLGAKYFCVSTEFSVLTDQTTSSKES